MSRDNRRPMVATVVDPSERPRLDAAAADLFAAVHTESVREAIRAVRERPVHAILVAPRRVGPDDLGAIRAMVSSFPGVPTVAVVSRHDGTNSERLLALGGSGVSRYVDLTHRDGWQQLRALVADPASPVAARILAPLIPALGPAPAPGCRLFFESLVRLAPGVATVRRLAQRFALPASTFVSRFLRSRLPTPKQYLAWTRLLHAAAHLEDRGRSIADVAYRLEYSSPQSFGRHVRTMLGCTAGSFRDRFPFPVLMEEYLQELIVPYRAVFTAFQPIHHHAVGLPGPRREGGPGGTIRRRRASPAHRGTPVR